MLSSQLESEINFPFHKFPHSMSTFCRTFDSEQVLKFNGVLDWKTLRAKPIYYRFSFLTGIT